jgi:hypothetical protein
MKQTPQAQEVLGNDARCSNGWCDQIPELQWRVYERVMDELRHARVDFALGGAFALATYTGQWRNTKDIDLYVRPADKERAIDVLVQKGGLTDYYDKLPYDRGWIFRGEEEGTIVDIIWALANHLSSVDDRWIEGGPHLTVRGREVKVIPVEEIIWAKLYVMQRERCDWPDILNLLYFSCDVLDWNHLVERAGDDSALLASVLKLFEWLCPERATHVPAKIWDGVMGRPRSASDAAVTPERARRIESRPWFRPIHDIARLPQQ